MVLAMKDIAMDFVYDVRLLLEVSEHSLIQLQIALPFFANGNHCLLEAEPLVPLWIHSICFPFDIRFTVTHIKSLFISNDHKKKLLTHYAH